MAASSRWTKVAGSGEGEVWPRMLARRRPLLDDGVDTTAGVVCNSCLTIRKEGMMLMTVNDGVLEEMNFLVAWNARILEAR